MEKWEGAWKRCECGHSEFSHGRQEYHGGPRSAACSLCDCAGHREREDQEARLGFQQVPGGKR